MARLLSCFLTAILFITLSALAGCGGGERAANEGGKPKSLTISWDKDIGDLNPHMYSPSQMFAQAMVYDPLVRYTPDGKIEPWLAESWSISPDGREYVFTLRKGVKFSDGTDFNASVAKKNFDAVLANAKRHAWLELINQIKDTETVDDYTLKITFKNPYYPALQELSLIRPLRFLALSGFPESGNTAEGIKKPVGTGPWVLSEYKKGEYAVFKRNEHYWGTRPSLEQVVVKIIPDGETRVMAFEKKEIDLIYGSGLISLDSFKQLRDSGKYEARLSGPLSTRILAVNSNRGPTKELKVRQALQHGFNKQAVIEGVFYGTEKMADTLFAPNFPYCDLGLKPYAYDVARAKSLLDEAGWIQVPGKDFREKDGKPLELELCFDSTNNVQKALAEVLQGDYKKIGVNLKLVGEESQSFNQRQKDGNFNLIFSDTWGAPYDPHSLLSSMRAPSHADYQAQAGLPMKQQLDQKIGEVLITTGEEERKKIYSYILGTLHEQAVYLPVSYLTNTAVYHKHVKGVDFLAQKYELPLQSIEVN